MITCDAVLRHGKYKPGFTLEVQCVTIYKEKQDILRVYVKEKMKRGRREERVKRGGKERERDRQTDRQTVRGREGERGQRLGETESLRDGETERGRARQRKTETDRNRQKQRQGCYTESERQRNRQKQK